MGIRPIRASRRWFALIAVAAVPLMLSGLYAAVPGNAASTVPAGVQAAAARTGHIAAGTVIQAATSNKPFVPTALLEKVIEILKTNVPDQGTDHFDSNEKNH